MNARHLIIFALCTWGLISCQNDPGKDKRVESVPVNGSISSIIRNPATANAPLDTVNVAKISFEETEYQFGEVTEGEEVIHVFRFTNTGKVPLLITDARSTCGCTVPSWPKDAIMPGSAGEIRVVFNTLNKANEQHKEVTITANTYPAQTKIALVGSVRAPE